MALAAAGKLVSARQKTVLGLGLALLILAATEWVSYRNTIALIASGRNLRHTYRVRDRLQRVLSLLNGAETGARGYVITGREGYLAPYYAAARSVDRHIEELKILIADNPARQRQFGALEPLIVNRLASLEHVIEVRRDHGLAAGVKAMRAGHSEQVMADIRAAMDAIRRAQRVRLTDQEAESRANTRRALVGLTVGAVLAFSILLLLFYRLNREIAERERAQHALGRNEKRLRSIIENASDLIALLDERYTITYVSPSHRRILGYAPADLVGKMILEFVHPDDLTSVRHALARLLDVPTVGQAVEFRFRHHEGSWRILEAHGSNLLGDPAVAAIVVNSRDLTERKRVDEVARQRQAELAHVLRVSTISEMAAGLAHEINQPLSAIVMYAKGCARRMRAVPAQSPELLEAMEEIATQAVRADQILRRLRNFVAKRPPQRGNIDLNDLVRGVARLVASETWERGITMQLELAELPLVRADSIQIEQVILNLVRNGLEAMHSSNGQDSVLSIQTSVVGRDVVEVAVCDAGDGIATVAADDVFNPFFTTKPDGLGMGLTISRSIIEAHGGRLWATPNPVRGATFRFTVPRAEGEHANAG